jgi:hypothetical protein
VLFLPLETNKKVPISPVVIDLEKGGLNFRCKMATASLESFCLTVRLATQIKSYKRETPTAQRLSNKHLERTQAQRRAAKTDCPKRSTRSERNCLTAAGVRQESAGSDLRQVPGKGGRPQVHFRHEWALVSRSSNAHECFFTLQDLDRSVSEVAHPPSVSSELLAKAGNAFFPLNAWFYSSRLVSALSEHLELKMRGCMQFQAVLRTWSGQPGSLKYSLW